MRHIVFVHKDFPYSGAEQVTIDIANYLCRHGYRVTVLVSNHRETAYQADSERLFDVKKLPHGKIKHSKKVAHAIRDFVLNEHVGVVVTYRELLYAKWLKAQTGVKMVFELHNTPYYEFLDLADKQNESRWKTLLYSCGVEALLNLFYKEKYRRVYGWCDAYGVLCPSYRSELEEKLGLTADNKVWVLPNSIAHTYRIVEQKKKVVLYVGRLTHRDKRVDRLLRIWHVAQDSLPDWQLKIVGDGKAAPQLKTQAVQLQLKRCSFVGHTPNVANFYDEASILCLTSSFEGWPMCVAEAQSHGVVPIVFNSFSGAKEQISNADEGILVPPYDEQLFVRQLTTLANDNSRLRRMQEIVMKKAATYTVERSGKAWEEMLNHLTVKSDEA